MIFELPRIGAADGWIGRKSQRLVGVQLGMAQLTIKGYAVLGRRPIPQRGGFGITHRRGGAP